MSLRKLLVVMSLPFCIFSELMFAQGISNNWLFGYSNGGRTMVNFDSLPPTPYLRHRKMNFREAEATMNDRNGNLLFYTNGIWIANSTGDTLQNGTGLSIGSFYDQFVNDGIPAPQAVLFLPNPLDSNLYYMFYQTYTADVNGYLQPPALFYCDINMNLDNGLGGVMQKNIPLVQDTLIASELTACKHGNGRDWWIVTHRYNSDLYYKFLLTPFGIQGPFVQNIGTVMYVRGPSQSSFSPDGKKFACYHPLEDLDIMDFDRCSGQFSNFIHIAINDSAGAGGLAFSSNSQLLYVSSTLYVYQFDLNASSIDSSKVKVATWDGFYSPSPPFATNFYLSQLAPDGKIYINSTNGVLDMHVINNPDSNGMACGLVQHSFHLPAYNARTIPNHPNYFLGADSGSVCDTLQLGFNERNSNRNSIFRIHPNPAVDIINLNFTPNDHIQELEIINVNGEIVLKRNIPQWSQLHQIDVRSLHNGIYLCRLKSARNTKSCKFIKE